MNIVLFFPHFNTIEQGSSLRSSQIGFYLRQQGHNVTVFAPGVDQRSEELLPELHGKLYAECDVEGVRLIRPRTISHFRQNAKRRLAYDLVFALLTFVRSLFIRSLDIIVVSYPPNVMPLFAYFLAKIRRLPLVFEMRDLVADNLAASNYVKSSFFINLAKHIERFVMKRSKYVISVSNGISKILVSRRLIDQDKISVVPLGYAPEIFEKADYSWSPRDKFGWEDRFVIIFAGTLNPAYDIPTLLRCARRLRDHEDILFVIIGRGEKRDEYEAYCETHALDNCQFIDFQPRQQLPVILSAANVGVHLFPDNPIWNVTLGNKVFDYLGSGLPLLFAGRGDTAELIQQAQAGYVVTPEDDQSLAEWIVHLKNHPSEARLMGEQGRQYVLDNYAVPKLLQKYEDVLVEATTEK